MGYSFPIGDVYTAGIVAEILNLIASNLLWYLTTMWSEDEQFVMIWLIGRIVNL